MDNLITTTELSKRTGHTAAVIIKNLERKGFKYVDKVIGSHHTKCWTPEAAEWLISHYEYVHSKKLLLEDYAKLLDVDLKTFREILYGLHINATIQTDRNPEIDKAVAEYKKQEQLQINMNEHPLVKDKRCFRLGWWPDITPKCFEDLDEDII